MKQDKRSGIYSSMAHAFLALPAAASAQVISIPLDPDIHLVAGGAFTEDSYSLDLDADGLYDIQFQITRLFSSYSQLALVNARLQPLGDASSRILFSYGNRMLRHLFEKDGIASYIRSCN